MTDQQDTQNNEEDTDLMRDMTTEQNEDLARDLDDSEGGSSGLGTA
jgi:hypothetical protein